MTLSVTLSALLLPCAVGLALSFPIERGLRPRSRGVWRRPASATAIHAGLWLLVFAAEFMLFRRPWFAMAMVQSLLLLLVLVSNAKFHSLREPFVFQDFEYFSDALKHPRLYLPFLGWPRAVAAAVVFGLVIAFGLVIEPPVAKWRDPEFFASVLGLMAGGIGLVAWGAARHRQQGAGLSFDPVSDLDRLGLLAALWLYARAERRTVLPASPFGPALKPDLTGRTLPVLLAVQSESFFDARRLSGRIRREVLGEFDRCCAEAECSGALTVPAWGANTVRTEFAFLSGLGAAQLGVHQFNPYRRLRDRETASLARYLKSLGYRTICVHPYPASFYRRNVVYPRLGFDLFIDHSAFSDEDRVGPYVGDLAVAKKVEALIEQAATNPAPLFIYVITMENHGPLHLETISPADAAAFYSGAMPAMGDELSIYLRHLGNADRMLARLCEKLNALPGPAGLCWFGDHVPILPRVYAALGLPSGQTDYLIWRNLVARAQAGSADRVAGPQPMAAESLGRTWLSGLGLMARQAPESSDWPRSAP
jgi:hypothetical protein